MSSSPSMSPLIGSSNLSFQSSGGTPGVPPLPIETTPDLGKNLSPHWHYESAVAKVEAIINQIETGNLELADIFEQFAIAVQHLQECEAFLKHHQQQVDILVESLTDVEES